MDHGRILAPLDAEHLQDQGLLLPGPNPGLRRLHRRRLNRSSDEEHRDLPLQAACPGSRHDAQLFAVIPAQLISHDTLLYLGLDERKAAEVWEEWTNWPATGPARDIDDGPPGLLGVSFIDFVKEKTTSREDVFVDDDERWRGCLRSCGVSNELENAIMDEDFRWIRITASCVAWVQDTIDMRYFGLKDIQHASRKREANLLHPPTRHDSGGRGGGRGGGTSVEQVALRNQAGRGQKRNRHTLSEMRQETAPGSSPQTWSSDVARSLREKPGHLVLYKGMDQGRMTGLFDDSIGSSDNNGGGGGAVRRIEKLLSMPPTTFSGATAVFYFSPDPRVAEYYAAFAKRRANCESIAMVCMAIPHAAMDSLEESEGAVQRLYWPSPQWKQLVWRSRTTRALPKPLLKYRDAALVIGTTSKGAPGLYERMETWEEVNHDCVLRMPASPGEAGQPAIQYVFNGREEGGEFLAENGDFRVFPFSAHDVEALRRHHRA